MSLKEKTLFLLDMDGTIYHENELIDGALDFFSIVKKQGKKYVFMTNNSSKSAKSYVEKLSKLGIDASTENIASSVDATVLYLKQHKEHAKIYLIGTESFKSELIENGFDVVPVEYRGLDIDFVVLGYDTELSYAKIEGACFYISRDFPYIGTNCDLRCPIKGDRYIPDCGAIAKLLQEATGRLPKFLGKPERTIVDVVSNRFGVPLSDIVCVGDRLYTDIAVGINAGIDSICVMTGEATKRDLENTNFKPTYVFDSIKNIYDELAR